MRVKIEEISSSTQFFTREEIDIELVERYSELLKSGITLPPLTVFRDEHSQKFIVLDGFHRHHATRKAGLEFLDIEVMTESTELDLFVKGVEKNSRHGKPLTCTERRKNLKKILSFDESWQWSNKVIAEIVGTSDRTVANVKDDHPSPKISGIQEVKCFRNGKLHTVKINTDKDTNEYKTALASCSSTPNWLLDSTKNAATVKGIANEQDSGQPDFLQMKNTTASFLPSDHFELSEKEIIELHFSMKKLQLMCVVYAPIYDLVNDDKEKITRSFLEKLTSVLVDFKKQTEELLMHVGNLGSQK